jgi:penicillin-binding protein 1A
VGFTGNFVCGVWFGNDDYTGMHQMTGGSLPAQTWREIVAYASQGIELKSIPGLGPQGPASPRTVAAESKKDTPESTPGRAASVLTKRGADALVRVERLLDDATRALAGRADATKASDETAPGRRGTLASASDRQPTGQAGGE